MSLPTIFTTCKPRADVEAGSVRDDEFMADLSRVVNRTAPEDYLDPAAFFAKSYPTRGMKELLKAVCLRLSGKGGEVSSIIRLGTQYGGGKTHSLIALVHAVRDARGVKPNCDRARVDYNKSMPPVETPTLRVPRTDPHLSAAAERVREAAAELERLGIANPDGTRVRKDLPHDMQTGADRDFGG